MSRGSARSALAERISAIVGDWTLPYRGGDDLRIPSVYEQFAPIENDEIPDAPCVIVSIGKVTQTLSNGEEARDGSVKLIVVTYAADSEQGYRDAENLIEAIETALIADPWIGRPGARYKLTGPWATDVFSNVGPVFGATLDCSIELPAVECVTTPGEAGLAEVI